MHFDIWIFIILYGQISFKLIFFTILCYLNIKTRNLVQFSGKFSSVKLSLHKWSWPQLPHSCQDIGKCWPKLISSTAPVNQPASQSQEPNLWITSRQTACYVCLPLLRSPTNYKHATGHPPTDVEWRRRGNWASTSTSQKVSDVRDCFSKIA